MPIIEQWPASARTPWSGEHWELTTALTLAACRERLSAHLANRQPVAPGARPVRGRLTGNGFELWLPASGPGGLVRVPLVGVFRLDKDGTRIQAAVEKPRLPTVLLWLGIGLHLILAGLAALTIVAALQRQPWTELAVITAVWLLILLPIDIAWFRHGAQRERAAADEAAVLVLFLEQTLQTRAVRRDGSSPLSVRSAPGSGWFSDP